MKVSTYSEYNQEQFDKIQTVSVMASINADWFSDEQILSIFSIIEYMSF